MTGDNSHRADELIDLLDRHIDGQADAAEIEQLRKLLSADDDARTAYFEYMFTESRLIRTFGPASTVAAEKQSAEKSDSDAIGQPSVETPLRSLSLLQRASRHPLRPAIAIAATLLIAALVVMGSIPVKDWMAGGGKQDDGDETAEKEDQEFVAKLSNWQNDKWLEGTRPPLDDPRLRVGRRLVLTSGLAEITYNTGSRVLLEGPAVYEVIGENSGFLDVGGLAAKVYGEKAQGFVVATPAGEIEDLGTEFLVKVRENGRTEMHVVKGRVRVRSTRIEGATPVPLRANQAALITDRVEKISYDPSGFVSEIQSVADTVEHKTFTGGDEGEGLDLSGNVVYAVNFGGPDIQVGPVKFLGHANHSDVKTNNGLVVPDFGGVRKFGDSAADDALEVLMQSIVCRTDSTGFDVLLPIATDSRYRLQMLFSESVVSNLRRHFNIFIDGEPIATDYEPVVVAEQAGERAGPSSVGTIISSQFNGQGAAAKIEFRPSRYGVEDGVDPYPYIQALVLTRIEPTLGSNAEEESDN